MAMASGMSVKEELLATNVRAYFEAHPDHWTMVCAYVNHTTLPDGDVPLSLREIDFFVRNYVNDNACVAHDAKGSLHDIANDYSQQKLGRHKQFFDPFRRAQVQPVTLHGTTLMTTYGQLAFFMWALQSGTLDYAMRHRDEIRSCKTEVLAAQRKARLALSPAASAATAPVSATTPKRKRPLPPPMVAVRNVSIKL